MRTWIANKLAYPIYAVHFLKKNKRARSILINVLIFGSLLYSAVGPRTFFALVEMASRLGFAAVFMVAQFLFLFMFLSRSKTLTVTPGEKMGKTLDDYKGQPILTKTMQAWVRVLQGDREFKIMGGEPPSGLLLHGPPGTGKTYLMQCLAGTAGVAMHAIEGSTFRAMFWGVDVLKVIGFVNKARNLAQEHGACIAYIDEIDAIGSSRGGVAGGAQGQMVGPAGFMGGTGALTTLLAQISGIGEERSMTTAKNMARKWMGLPPLEEGYVMFVGGTNRPDVLDPALTRPGRLDKKIAVDPPDGPGRKDIFWYYLQKVRHEDIDLDSLVTATHGITPASIQAAVTKDAVRMAWMDGRDKISYEDIAASIIEQFMGLPNPIGDLPEEQRRQVAAHEAGHALVSHLLRPDMRIAFLSTVRRGGALGFMMPVQKETTYTVPLRRFVADIRVSLGGDVATKVMLGERWTGAAMDLEHVRQRLLYLAWHGVFGGIMLSPGVTTPEMEEAIQRFMETQWDETESLILENQPALEALTNKLLEVGEMSGLEATRILEEFDEQIESLPAESGGTSVPDKSRSLRDRANVAGEVGD